MLLPNCGPLPQTSQTCAMAVLQILWCPNPRWMVRPQHHPGRLFLTRPAVPSLVARNEPAERGAQRHTAPRLAEFPVYPETARDPNSPNCCPRSTNPAPDDNSAKKNSLPGRPGRVSEGSQSEKGSPNLVGKLDRKNRVSGLAARRLTPRARRCRSIPRQTC